MVRMTGVVRHLLIINLIVYFGSMLLEQSGVISGMQLALYPIQSDYFRPYQLASHMFMHGGISHLLFNMLALFFLGPLVEQTLGPKRFLTLYLAAGFGAMLLHVLIFPYIPIVGASGSIYGVMIAFALLYPNLRLMLLFPPIPVKAKYLALAYIAYDLISGLGNAVGGLDTGIAHFAHLGGGLMGFILLSIWGLVRWK